MANTAIVETTTATKEYLTVRQLKQYERNGFLIVPSVFSASEIVTIRAAFLRLHARSQALKETHEYNTSQFVISKAPTAAVDAYATLRVVWAGGAEPILERLGSDDRLLGLASAILGTEAMVQLINQAHFKHPNDGVSFHWHQDSKHRRQGTDQFRDLDGHGSFVETLTAIDPMTASNGPLEILVGSHQEGHLGMEHSAELERMLRTYTKHVVTLNPGDVLLLSPFATHRSLENCGEMSRYAFLNGFALLGASRRIYPGCGLGRFRKLGHKSS